MHFSMAIVSRLLWLPPPVEGHVSRSHDLSKPAGGGGSVPLRRCAGGLLHTHTRLAAIPKFSVSPRPGKDLARYESYQMVNLLGRFDHERPSSRADRR